MPFDSSTIIEAPRRPLAVHDLVLEFATNPPATDRLKARPIPRWHSSLHDEQRWCRRTYARGWRGLPVPVQSSAAHRFCAVGALMRAGRELGLSMEDARNAIEWQTVRPVQDWNDDPERTHGEVIAAFDAAVDALERSGA
jgi:hypothetical protein